MISTARFKLRKKKEILTASSVSSGEGVDTVPSPPETTVDRDSGASGVGGAIVDELLLVCKVHRESNGFCC